MILKFEENEDKSIEFDLHTQKDCFFITTNVFTNHYQDDSTVLLTLTIEDAKNLSWYLKKYLENE